MSVRSAVLLVLVVTTSPTAEPKRDWLQGTWRDASQTIISTKAGIVPGTVVDGCVISPEGGEALGVQICAIETVEAFYFGRKRLNFGKRNAVPVTVNAPVRFALEKKTLYVIGDDQKEYKLELMMKVPK